MTRPYRGESEAEFYGQLSPEDTPSTRIAPGYEPRYGCVDCGDDFYASTMTRCADGNICRRCRQKREQAESEDLDDARRKLTATGTIRRSKTRYGLR